MAIDPNIPLQAKAPDVMGNLGQILGVARGAVDLQTAQEGAQQQHLKTMHAQIANGAQQMLSLYGTGASPDEVRNKLTQVMVNAGAQPDAIKQATMQIPNDAAQVDKYLVNTAQSALSTMDQLASKFPSPVMVSTGARTVPVSGGSAVLTGVQPGTPQGVALTQELPPTTLVTTPTGAKQYLGATKPGAAGRPIAELPYGEKEKAVALAEESTNARNFLLNAPAMHTNNEGILKEIETATTGSLGPTIQRLQSSLGLAFDTPEKAAASYDLLGKYQMRNAVAAAQSMGPKTNAGLQASIETMGSQTFNKDAIKKVTKLTDAIVTGGEAYAQGSLIAEQKAGGPLGREMFDRQWASVFKPEVFEYFKAIERGDTQELRDLERGFGYKGDPKDFKKSPQYADLIRRAKAMETLSETGKLAK